MTSGTMPNQGNSYKDDHAQSLAATRALGVAASELSRVVGTQAVGIPLCIFGIAFAATAVGIRAYDPQYFDLPVLLTIFGFAALLMILGVLAAILRKEENLQARSSHIAEIITINSRPITSFASSLNVSNYKVLESVRDASSIDDLRSRLGKLNPILREDLDRALLGFYDESFSLDLDIVRIALGRAPLSGRPSIPKHGVAGWGVEAAPAEPAGDGGQGRGA